jgi:hypothetical protein
MSEYQDGQIVNGWRYVAADNSWVQATGPNQPVTLYTDGYGLTPATPKKNRYGLWILAGVGVLIAGTIFLSVLGAVIAGGTPQTAPQPQPAAQAPAPPAPEPAPYQPPADTYENLADVALESAWDQQSTTDQQTICNAWNLGEGAQEVILDQFSEAVAATTITRSDIRFFFDRKC